MQPPSRRPCSPGRHGPLTPWTPEPHSLPSPGFPSWLLRIRGLARRAASRVWRVALGAACSRCTHSQRASAHPRGCVASSMWAAASGPPGRPSTDAGCWDQCRRERVCSVQDRSESLFAGLWGPEWPGHRVTVFINHVRKRRLFATVAAPFRPGSHAPFPVPAVVCVSAVLVGVRWRPTGSPCVPTTTVGEEPVSLGFSASGAFDLFLSHLNAGYVSWERRGD